MVCTAVHVGKGVPIVPYDVQKFKGQALDDLLAKRKSVSVNEYYTV